MGKPCGDRTAPCVCLSRVSSAFHCKYNVKQRRCQRNWKKLLPVTESLDSQTLEKSIGGAAKESQLPLPGWSARQLFLQDFPVGELLVATRRGGRLGAAQDVGREHSAYKRLPGWCRNAAGDGLEDFVAEEGEACGVGVNGVGVEGFALIRRQCQIRGERIDIAGSMRVRRELDPRGDLFSADRQWRERPARSRFAPSPQSPRSGFWTGASPDRPRPRRRRRGSRPSVRCL